MNFLALDVETANEDYSSICQIGIAEFKDGQITNKWSSLINPEDYFNPFNTHIHGIREKDVTNAPTFKEIYPDLLIKIQEKIVVHHMPFDRIAINRACEKYNLDPLEPIWLDSAKIARRTWTEFAYSGYSLANISEFLKIDFIHHNALEDAIAAGYIVHKACAETGLTIDEWIDRIKKPIHVYHGKSSSIKLEGNPEGPLYGHNLVFTGALSMTRYEAGKIAAQLGCNVSNSVSKKTTILVVGTQDRKKLAGYEKSSKHRKAEELIKKGVKITIMSENDFLGMLKTLSEIEKKVEE